MKCQALLTLVLTMLAFPFVTCDSAPTVNAPRSGAPGTRVETQGGAYTNISPLELESLLAKKNFPLINVHIPYESEIENKDEFIASHTAFENPIFSACCFRIDNKNQIRTFVISKPEKRAEKSRESSK